MAAKFKYMTSFTNIPKNHKGPFKYYVIKEMGGRGGQMMMFDDKVGGWGWLNADVSKKCPSSVSKLT